METILDGSKKLLIEAAQGLKACGIDDYIVIGGWCPYLFRGDYYHPGTIDVDILFHNASVKGYLKQYVEHMLKENYFTSAKHQFQLLTVKEIKEQRFCYNIDLLHTSPTIEEADFFVDHLDLNVLMSEEERRKIKILSIVQRESELLFQEHLFTKYDLGDGLSINIVDFTGMFITKMISCQKIKRDRDSYDIYLGFMQDKVDVSKVFEIAKHDPRISKSLDSFQKFLSKEQNLFNRRVKSFNKELKGNPSQFILSKIKELE